MIVFTGNIFLQQIRDAGNHLCSALEVASRNDDSYVYKSEKEVFMVSCLVRYLNSCFFYLSHTNGGQVIKYTGHYDTFFIFVSQKKKPHQFN